MRIHGKISEFNKEESERESEMDSLLLMFAASLFTTHRHVNIETNGFINKIKGQKIS